MKELSIILDYLKKSVAFERENKDVHWEGMRAVVITVEDAELIIKYLENEKY